MEDIEKSFEVIHKALSELAYGAQRHNLDELEISQEDIKPLAFHLRNGHSRTGSEAGGSDTRSTPMPPGTLHLSLADSRNSAGGSEQKGGGGVFANESRTGSPPRWKRRIDEGASSAAPAVPGGGAVDMRRRRGELSNVTDGSTSTDSDDEGGVTMNPLNLLAASASAARPRGNRSGQMTDRSNSPVHDAAPLPPRFRMTPYQQLDSKAYWRKDQFQPVPDVGEQAMDLIEIGMVTEEKAEQYLQQYFRGHNSQLRLLDPHLCTLQYLRRQSGFLLGVICGLEARFTDGDEQLALAIRKYMHENIIPKLMCPPSFKSLEIGQGFVILLAFGSAAERVQFDRTWTFLMAAVRMATELGFHLTPISPHHSTQRSEQDVRQQRNRERFWLVLWNQERLLCAQTGRPSLMPRQPFDNWSGKDWHVQPYALPFDAVTVANIELEMIVSHHHQLYRTLISDSTQDLAVRLQFYRDAVASELSKWKTSYALRSTPEQIHALSSARMLLCSLPIRDRRRDAQKSISSLQSRELRNECRLAALEFVESCAAQPVEHLVYATNNYIIAAVHAAVLSVQFASRPLSPIMLGQNSGQTTLEKVRSFAEKLLASSKIPQSRSWNSFAASYAALLSRILSRTNAVQTSKQIEGQQSGRVLPSPTPSGHSSYLPRSMMVRQNFGNQVPPLLPPQQHAASTVGSNGSGSPSLSTPAMMPPMSSSVPTLPALAWPGSAPSPGSFLNAASDPNISAAGGSAGALVPSAGSPSQSFMNGAYQQQGASTMPSMQMGWPAAMAPSPTSMAWPEAERPGPALMLENIMDQLMGLANYAPHIENEQSDESREYRLPKEWRSMLAFRHSHFFAWKSQSDTSTL